jgi:hypothetical protein
MALEKLDEGLWVVAAPHTFLGLHLGTRMTVLRLRGGGLFLHSVVAMTGPLRTAVEALGPVQHIVLPDLYHHLYVGPWAQAYPKARVHAPPGMARKRPDLRIDAELSEVPHPDWAGELKHIFVAGCGLGETVFVHPRTRTLLVADLLENFPRGSRHWLTGLYLRAAGLQGRVGFSSLLRWLYRDRPRARASLERIYAEDFERILLAHGDVIPSGGKEALRLAYGWL